jgi:RNA polymerase sigma-70 factor (ECF subfamily)
MAQPASATVLTPGDPGDEGLLRQFVERDNREALGTLFSRHADAAFRLARRILNNDSDAEDAVQTAFVQIFHHAAQHRGEASVKAWMMGFVINACQHHIRGEARRSMRNDLASELRPMTAGEAPDRELQAAVLTAIEKLPQLYRAPLWLRYYEDMAPNDVAVALKVSEKTVRSQMSRGIEILRETLAAAGFTTTSAALVPLIAAAPAPGAPAALTAALAKIAVSGSAAVGTAAAAKAASGASTSLKLVLGIVGATAIAAVVLMMMPPLSSSIATPLTSPTPPAPVVAAPVLAAVPATGHTYFADANLPGASDRNSGLSEDKPFKTLARAVLTLQPGDTLTIKRGEYREAVTIIAHGTKENPITIRARPGDEGFVVIKGSDIVENWTKDSEEQWSAPWIHSLPVQYPPTWPKFDDLDQAYILRAEMLFVDGVMLKQVCQRKALERGTFFVDDAQQRIVICLNDGSEPAGHLVEAAVRQQGLVLGKPGLHAAWVSISGLTVTHVADSFQTNAAFEVQGDDILLQGNRAELNNFYGMRVRGHRITMRHNSSSGNGCLGLVGNIFNSVLEENITDNNSWRFGPHWNAGGVLLMGTGPSENVIRGHISRNNNGPGIWLDVDCRKNTIERCFIQNNVHVGVFLNGTMAGNVVVNNVICGTRAIQGRESEVGAGSGIAISSSLSVEVYNNTIVYNDQCGIFIGGPKRDNGAFSGNARCMNNIIALNGAGGIYLGQSRPEDTKSHSFDYNLWYQQPGTYIVSFGKERSAKTTLSQWQAALGQDLHSLATDPQFMDVLHYDFRLKPESPALGKGTPLGAVTNDFTGAPRTGKTSDLGAYSGSAAL